MARKRSRSGLGVLFWIAFILLVLVVFLINRPRIESVLESTQLIEVIQRRFTDDADDTAEDPVVTRPEIEPTAPLETVPVLPDVEVPDARPDVDTDILPEPGPEPETEETVTPEPRPDVESRPAPPPEEDAEPARVRRGPVYYIRVTDDGRIHPEGVERSVQYESAPLTRTIEVLLSGPSSTELSRGLLNLIPDGSQLLSASVRNGVAYLSFNEAFRFNPMGVEGYHAQLKQIIYSATEFPSIDRVQFLIEGQNVEWLGGEGVNIGTPLGRNSFSN